MKVQSNTAHNCSCTAANHMQDWLEDWNLWKGNNSCGKVINKKLSCKIIEH
jgi:hypothetical protein